MEKMLSSNMNLGFQQITEVPFVASATGDGFLSGLVANRRSRERLRSHARILLGIPQLDPVSFGSRGRVSIEPLMLTLCSQLMSTAPAVAERFKHDLVKYGVLESNQENASSAMRAHVVSLLQNCLATSNEGIPLAGRVNQFLSQLTLKDESLQSFARQKRRQWCDLSREERPFTRLPGQFVRMEDGEALLAVWNESTSREELRTVDAIQLAEAGEMEEGDPLVLYEIDYIPGVRVTTVMRGIAPVGDAQ